jgi:hypothetical protein
MCPGENRASSTGPSRDSRRADRVSLSKSGVAQRGQLAPGSGPRSLEHTGHFTIAGFYARDWDDEVGNTSDVTRAMVPIAEPRSGRFAS